MCKTLAMDQRNRLQISLHKGEKRSDWDIRKLWSRVRTIFMSKQFLNRHYDTARFWPALIRLYYVYDWVHSIYFHYDTIFEFYQGGLVIPAGVYLQWKFFCVTIYPSTLLTMIQNLQVKFLWFCDSTWFILKNNYVDQDFNTGCRPAHRVHSVCLKRSEYSLR